jgi:hypothetical protein
MVVGAPEKKEKSKVRRRKSFDELNQSDFRKIKKE